MSPGLPQPHHDEAVDGDDSKKGQQIGGEDEHAVVDLNHALGPVDLLELLALVELALLFGHDYVVLEYANRSVLVRVLGHVAVFYPEEEMRHVEEQHEQPEERDRYDGVALVTDRCAAYDSYRQVPIERHEH